jgi:hypothetical protein
MPGGTSRTMSTRGWKVERPDRGKAGRTAVFLLPVLLAVSAVAVPSGRAGSGEYSKGAPPPGWEEATPGWRLSLPEREVEVLDNAVKGTFHLAPGTGVVLSRSGSFSVDQGESLEVALVSTGTNAASRDYSSGDVHFPVAVTAVFGHDDLARPIRKRAWSALRGLGQGRSFEGIGLTYAWGNDAPVGSMYRLEENETVFILAGPDEAGRRIADRRDIRKDFAAAYGRVPQGRVTQFIIRAERPVREKGPIRAEILLAFPGL